MYNRITSETNSENDKHNVWCKFIRIVCLLRTKYCTDFDIFNLQKITFGHGHLFIDNFRCSDPFHCPSIATL